MVRRMLAVGLALTLTAPPRLAGQDPVDTELTKGIRQAQTGDFENAVVSLDAAAKRLVGRPRDLARAYVYLSIAYLGLSQEQKAKAQFLEAWRMDKGMDLSAKEFPPKVLQFFEEAKAEAKSVKKGGAATAEAPAATPTPAAIPTAPAQAKPEAKKGGASKGVLIGLGVAAAVGGGVALAGGKGSPAPPATMPVGRGTFTLLSAAPSAGGTITLPANTGSGSSRPILDYQFTYPRDLTLGVGNSNFQVSLMRGATECLVTQIAYSQRLDRSDVVYVANSTARFQSGFWVIRGYSASGGSDCGSSFTTDQVAFRLEDFQQTLNMGWVFVAAP